MFTYDWKLSQLRWVPKNWYKVFSCFSCGWWSTMWYKMSWYDVIGTCEIDPRMNKVYQQNHGKGINYEMWVWDMKALDDRIIWIDILDWSPPCSTFSMTWLREKAWGKAKKFKEWQAVQILDDLFFQFIDLAEKLQPKIIIAENVKGMLKGKAKWYVKMIVKRLDKIWYITQVFMLNGASMWLPQARERVFFVSRRKELWLSNIKLTFNEPIIPFKEISDDTDTKENVTKKYKEYRLKAKRWESVWKFKCIRKTHPEKVLNTITAANIGYHHKYIRELNDKELCKAWSYPSDYDFMWIKPGYLIGMSVPPIMMHRISKEIQLQRLDTL